MAFTKRALIRDSSVPVGRPAPTHIECRCGNTVNLESDQNRCPCGAIYDAGGYVMQASEASLTEVASQYH